MDTGISFLRMWADDDMVELRIEVNDGTSTFGIRVYAGHQRLKDTAAGLERFKDQIHGGIYDLRFGEFGPEYASGAFHARLQFQHGGHVHITISAQSEYFDFGKKHVANECTVYMMTEPAPLDDFVRGLKALSDGHVDKASLGAWSTF
ncbi:hypothetical protein [Janthinobacterium sp. J1-1]|uniref:hypothetical protein n=1 Tax=unclassified Janthinobacterium TaxID=2610881 RepID=UPI002811AAFC|nr:hypothetical protein [Janthinobacterium sp. J1-1]